MSPTTGYVRKSGVRWLVVGLFVFNSLVLAGGLQFVKDYAASQATKATTLATNRTACALRALVEPTIAADLLTLKSYQLAAKDKTAKPSARARNAKRVTDTQTKIYAEQAFLRAYVTIPPNFDCSSLPPIKEHP